MRRGRGKIHTRFWWGSLREVDYLKDIGVEGRKGWGQGLDLSGSGQG
jgi:hypothetical protein